MPAHLLIGLLAGLTSVVLYLGTSSGSLLGLLLALISPLPIFMAGLGWGTVSAIVAAVAASLALLGLGMVVPALAGWQLALIYLITTAAVPVWLTRLSLLRRAVVHDPQHTSEEWYPAGRLLLWIALVSAVALVSAGLLAFQADPHGLPGLTKQVIDQIMPPGSETRAMAMAETKINDWETLSLAMASTVPATGGIVWQVVMVTNGLLAHAMLRATHHNIRPAIGWQSIALPKVYAFALPAAILATFAGGTVAFFAGSLAAILFVPYFFLGLTVVHAIPARGAGRMVLLGLVYTVLLILYSPAILIGILGLLEQWTGIRARFLAASRREDG